MATNPPQIQTSASGPIRVKAPANPMYSVLLLLLSIMLLWFLVWPKYVLVRSKSADLDQLKADQQVFGQQQENLDKLVEQLHSSNQDVSLLDEALPLDNRLSKVYVLVETFARSAGLNLVNVNADTGDSLSIAGNTQNKDATFAKQRTLFTSLISLNLNGSYDQFVTFLGFVEQSSRIIDVDSVDIAPGENSQLVFHVKLKSYFYTTADVAAAASTPAQ